jgi:hypothetical protein
MPQAIVFLEVAATGTDPRLHEVWEIAYVRRRPARPDEEWIWQYRPESLAGADPARLRTDRYYERMACPAAGTAEAISAAAAGAAESHNALNSSADEKSRDDWVDLKRRLRGPVLASLIAGHLDRAVVVSRDPALTAAFMAAFLQRNGEAGTWTALESIASRAGGYLAAAGRPIPAGSSAVDAFGALGLVDDPDRWLPPAGWADLDRQAWDRTTTALEDDAPSTEKAEAPADEPEAEQESDDGPGF